jgi:AbrB family looped-hinge helix DNA binding protein
MSSVVTSRGQVTLPKKLREAAGIKPGDRVDVGLMPGQGLIISSTPKNAPGKHLSVRDIRRITERYRKHLVEPDITSDEFMALMRGDD